MSKWVEVVLDKVCETITDGTHLTPALAERGVPLYNGADINNMKIYNTSPSKFISRETDNVLATRCKPQGNDVLISSRGSIGKVAIVDEGQDFNIMGNIILCRPSQEKLLSWFLGYYLKGKQNKLEELAHGVAQKGLYLSTMRDLQIPLPPLETQKQIAKTLDTAAELLAMRKQQLAELDNLIKSTFYDMFGDPVTNEKDWEMKKLSELVYKLGDGLHGTPEYSDDGAYYFINGNNLHDGNISVNNTTKKVSADEYEKYKKDLNLDTMLVSINGTLGNVAFYHNEKIILGKSACYFNVFDFVSKKYLYYILKSDYFLKYALESATGSTIKNVSLKSMREFPVLYPPMQLQTQFAEIVTKIEEQKVLVKKAIDETQYLFDSLMSQYFE